MVLLLLRKTAKGKAASSHVPRPNLHHINKIIYACRGLVV